VEFVGRSVRTRVNDTGFVVDLLLRTVLAVRLLPRRTRFTLDMAFNAGVRALPVTMVVAAFAGAILAMQTGIELRRLGDTGVLGTITALSMCREMGPFITGVILAATVGSSMAAEIGTMKVSDEVTALEVMSVDPVNYLVLPRVIALAVMCPLLTVLSDLVGTFGGSIVAMQNLGVSQTLFWNSVVDALTESGATLVPVVGADNAGFVGQLSSVKGLKGAAVTNPGSIGGAGVTLALKILGGEKPAQQTTLVKPELWENVSDAGKAKLAKAADPSLSPEWPVSISIPDWTTYSKEQIVACKGPGE